MSRALFALFLLLALTATGKFAAASPKPPTREQMLYARREVELETQLSKASMVYTAANPRIIALHEKIRDCERRTTLIALMRARRGKQPSVSTLEQELAQEQEDLRELQLRYRDTHPLVKAAQQSINDTLREIATRKQK